MNFYNKPKPEAAFFFARKDLEKYMGTGVSNVRKTTMQQIGLHLEREAPGGMRSENGHAMDERSAHRLLRERCESSRSGGNAAPQGRGESPMGAVLTPAGWFWIGYGFSVVLTLGWWLG